MAKDNGPRRLVQSLLSFSANISPARRDNASPSTPGGIVNARSTTKPPPALPPELWELILSTLGNFSIKKFRLVHPQWASIGARYLFETVYLNVHQHSVAGLIEIAGSTHAPLVKNIIWSPLALWPDCLEAERWQSTYENLLKNVKHTELVQLHQMYRRLFRDQKNKTPDNQLTDLATALGKLVNCHQFTIHDGLKDMESACCDPELRSAVQKSPAFHRASIWVSKPRLGFDRGPFIDGFVNEFIVGSCIETIGSLQFCRRIATVTVSCQEWFWNRVAAVLITPRFRGRQSEWRGYGMAFSNVRTLCMILERPIFYHPYLREISLEYLGSLELPELVDLTLKIIPLRSRNLDQRSTDDAASLHSDNNIGFHENPHDDTMSQSESTWSSPDWYDAYRGWISDRAWRSGPVPVDNSDAARTHLSLGLVRFRRLEKLTLGHVLVDTDLLLAWCWVQPRLPHSKITITMVDVVILDQLALQDFVSALASLNVELMYEHWNTGYFERSEWSLKLSIENRRMVVDSKRFSDQDGWEDYVSEKRALKLMPPMAELPQPKTKVVVPQNRTHALSAANPFLYYPTADDGYGIEPDEEYILDFWEDARKPAVCITETIVEEADVMDVDEDSF
jgi:hypothetical protein